MSSPQDSSWTMKRLFKLKQLGQPLIRDLVGNGRDTFLWLYNWHSMGPLYKQFRDRVLVMWVNLYLLTFLTLFAMAIGSGPAPPKILLPNGAVEDSVCYELLQLVWCTLLKQLGRLSEYLGCRAPWHAIVWFKKNVPRGPPLSFGYAAGKGYLPKIEC
ncbi:hypothetical protein Acr_00g0072720 [Actinidia rufa]|uniref:Uncharacterized protein n=1 Tax=Actinidia rufa TaxID=165716 RepID=A0A7J0DT86_9ERIC|nr:hypothetical protein Acr_00g0072720 [Actinidia rufa]